MSQLEPDNPIYNVAGAVRLDGALRGELLAQALSEVVRRHEILRSRFLALEGGPCQQVETEAQLPLEDWDLSALAENEKMPAFETRAQDFIRRPFRLDLQPPLRGAWVDLGGERHILLLVLHHMVSDRWSVAVLMQEVATLYQASAEGRPSPLPELAIQYADYCVWQRGRDAQRQSQLEYWTAKLAGAPPLLELPLDRPRPPQPSYSGEVYRFELSEDLSRQVKQLAGQHKATLFMVMAAAFSALLHRYSGSRDFCIGYPAAGRNRSQVASLIGFFVNTLVLRCRVDDEISFADCLAQLREQALQDQNHQELAFGQLLDALNPPRNPSHAPLFQVMLAVQNVPAADFRMGNLNVSPLTLNNGAAQFDLTLFVDEGEGRLACSFEYAKDLFAAETIERMAGHLQTLLAGACRHPDSVVSRLPLLSADEYRQWTGDWSGKDEVYPQQPLIHQWFAEQAARYSNRPALVFADRTLSYRQLDDQAEAWALTLNRQGLGRGNRVGVSLQRSVELIVVLLGVLKSGAAYVPLDPDYPDDRLAFMLADASVDLLVTHGELAGKFARDGLALLLVDQAPNDMAKLAVGGEKPERHEPGPHDIAYVIYTSGSTGSPKGVAVSHGNLLHSTLVRTRYYQEPFSGFLLLSSFAFDSSVAGIFWTLTQGASLCLPQKEALTDPRALAGLIECHGISHLLALPSFYAAIADAVEPARLPSLKAVIVAGEACSGEVAAKHRRLFPDASFYNEYGPTENSVWSSVYRLDGEPSAMLPIGRPIDNVRIYILDRCLQPVPAGVSGELFVGGLGVAQGYLNRPELTAERFVPDFFQAGGGRLYKTGDLARYRADGMIEFLGRIDHQVKIRGFRIELGEIEARLLTLPGVKEAVVLAREDHPGDKRLVAYIVEAKADCLQVGVLKHELKQVLPDYMMPSAFVVLDEMPLSANGKLDRKQLPAPDWNGQGAGQYEAPQSSVEVAFAQIWQGLLGVERVGRHDNFFALGGDSILSIQMVSRARQAGIVVTPKQLFERPTIAELATVAETASTAVAEQGMVTGNVALTPIQHWFFGQGFVDPHHWNQALILSVKPELTPAVFEAALRTLLVQHDALRMRFMEEAGRWRQTNLGEEAHKIFECVDLSTVLDEQRGDLLRAKAGACQASLNLSQGPLLRAVWFELGNGERRVVIVIHHLVVDGVSWRILLEDLESACRQGLAGQNIRLPAKTTSFQYWAERLKQVTHTGDFELNLDYWLDPCRRQAQTLPVDYPAGINLIGSEDAVTIKLSIEQTRVLLQEVPKAYRTQVDDLLLTALVLALCDWSNSQSQMDTMGKVIGADSLISYWLIECESHGREHLRDDLDVSRTVGWFTTVYPVLLSVNSSDGLAQHLKSIKEQLRSIPGNGIGYSLLRYLSDDAEIRQNLASQPQPQIIFNYLGQLDTALEDDGLFALGSDPVGVSYDLASERAHELDVVASIQAGQLQLSWRYSRARYRRATLKTLAGHYQFHLEALIDHCRQAESGGYTPSDFPLAALTQTQLDALDLTPRMIEDVYPLSPLQHGLMFHSLYQPDTNVYRIQLSCRLTGPLEISAFKLAWQQLLQHHAILRTRFWVQGLAQPLQIVEHQAKLSIVVHDWREMSESEQQQRWQTMQVDDRQQGYDFHEAPLMRLNLARIGEKQHYLLWSYHHILIDGWSMPMLIREVFTIYHELRRGEELKLVPTQAYRNYIAWLQNQDMAAAEHYWRDQLAGFESVTVLGVDMGRGSKSLLGENRKHQLVLTADETQCLQRCVRHQKLSLNTLMQAAWALLLSHYSGTSDVVFGITVAGRPAELIGIEQQVGLFINTLPVRVRIAPQTSLCDWLQAMFEHNQTLRRYEYAPLAQIQIWSELGRGQSLFDSLLVFENYPIDQTLMNIEGELVIDEVSSFDLTNYPLNLTVSPGECLRLEISYDSGRFSDSIVTEMLEHLRQLLKVCVDRPQAKLGTLPMLSEAKQRQILKDCNATEVEYPKELCIHQLFEVQVEKMPDAIALTIDGLSLSYTELNARANQLSRYLVELGVGPDVVVAIGVQRSLDMFIAVLAILKAGGAYLPLDLNYPSKRLEFMLKDSEVAVILTRSNLLEFLKPGEFHRVNLDLLQDKIDKLSEENLNVTIFAKGLVYVLYTSGTTDRPKAVMVQNENLVNAYYSWRDAYRLGDKTRSHLQMASLSFDVCAGDFVRALLSGDRLVICPRDILLDAPKLYRLLRNEHIKVAEFVPAVLRNLISYMEHERLNISFMDLLICGSDSWGSEEYNYFLGFLGDHARLVNSYGLTEVTIDSIYFEDKKANGEELLAIGRPFNNTKAFILNNAQQPLPIGVAGELFLAGNGITRGYLKQPGLTAEKFIPNPYGPDGSRMYKTGDLARYRPDGNIEYLGRIDHQVKIRGFRIELGEIESQLVAHPEIKEAVVLAKEDQAGGKRLVAYLVEEQPGTLQLDNVKTKLKQVLPDYMLPSAFVVLGQMPLSPNGKLDRKKLPDPDFEDHRSEQYIAPRNEIETRLTEIWQEVLGVERVGIEDDFFELGGHSLLATQLASRVAKCFAIDMPLRSVFEAGNVATLAEKIDVLLWATRPEAVEAGSFNETDFEEIEF
ncbi:hypothetical protein BJL95_09280 [Methylomonas sp. LWB]|nr:hypothetical protein BJL95_09280 [Methylomonas sp. LWB]